MDRTTLSADDPVVIAARDAWRPQDKRKVWEWCDAHCYAEPGSPMPGKFRSENSPWIREPLEAWGDNRIQDVTVMCSAQSTKTTLAQLAMMWAVSEDPGRALWVTHDGDMAKEDLRDRYLPMFRACARTRDLILKEQTDQILFRTMPLYYVGSHSPGKLQSKPIRWLVMDEVRNYPPNAVPTVLKRTRSYWNSRRLKVSTPGDEFDAIHRGFLEGDQRVFHASCPMCGALFPLKFEELRAQHPETGQACNFRDVPGFVPDTDTYNFNALSGLIRYQCPGCAGLIPDKPAERKHLARAGRFIAQNPNAAPGKVSFNWNALLPFWVSWSSIVEEYFNALSALRKGQVEPMRTFVTETKGEPWKEELAEIDDYEFLEDRRGEYELGEVWADEATRFMAADRQAKGGKHYFWVVRAFNKKGKSRLIAHGKCNSDEELRQKAIELEVPAANCALDSGHMASAVYQFCLTHGWKAFKGDDAQWFVVSEVLPNGKKRSIRRAWDRSMVDAFIGKGGVRRLMKLYRWSNPRFFDLLASCMMGTVEGWSIPKHTEREYMRHLSAYVREEIQDALGRPKLVWRRRWEDDHLRDCELEILVMAAICRLIEAPERIEKGDVPPISDDPSGIRPDMQTRGG